MQAIEMDSRIKTTALAVLLIVFGGILGFFLGGTFAANIVAGESPVSDAAVVTLSAIGTGILGAAFGFFICSRMRS